MDQRVNSFDVDDLCRIDAILSLAKRQQIPLGIEYFGPQLFEHVTLHAGPNELITVTEGLLPASSGFRISIQDDVLNIGHVDVPIGHSGVLDTVLEEFSIRREFPVCMAEAVLRVALARHLRPDPLRRYAVSAPGPQVSQKIGPFTMNDVTVRQALNRIVHERGQAAWYSLPDTIDPIPDLLATTIEYDSPFFDRISAFMRRPDAQRKHPGHSERTVWLGWLPFNSSNAGTHEKLATEAFP
jgi:hypothetical protein